MTKKTKTPEEKEAIRKKKAENLAKARAAKKAKLEEAKKEAEKVEATTADQKVSEPERPVQVTEQIPSSHRTPTNKYKDSFNSIFTYVDPDNPGKEHSFWIYKWNERTQEKERAVIKISATTYSQLFVDNGNGDMNYFHMGATTSDTLVKSILRKTTEYQANVLQEWRMTDEGRLERIKVNRNNEIVVMESKTSGQRVAANDLSEEELEEILANKKRARSNVSYETATQNVINS